MPKKLSLQEINARLIVLGFSSINEQVLTNEKCELICPRCDKKFMIVVYSNMLKLEICYST
jgi:hypothetical protein